MATVEKPVEKEKSHDSASVIDEKHADETIYDGDSIVEGSEDVTYHELETLRHVADHINWGSWLIIIVEFSERRVVVSSVFFSN